MYSCFSLTQRVGASVSHSSLDYYHHETKTWYKHGVTRPGEQELHFFHASDNYSPMVKMRGVEVCIRTQRRGQRYSICSSLNCLARARKTAPGTSLS